MVLAFVPDNIFISSEGRAYIGDYGGLTPLGQPIRETTPLYIPSDYSSDIASESLDRWMLVVSLLELTQNSEFSSPLHSTPVWADVEGLQKEELKAFLASVIPASNVAVLTENA